MSTEKVGSTWKRQGRIHIRRLPVKSFTAPLKNRGKRMHTILTRMLFHLLQVEMSAQPEHTSAAPAIAAQAQPGMHRNNSSSPALMKTHPSSFHNPSSGGFRLSG